MIMNTEKIKISRNRKRIEQNFKMDDKMKSLINKLKTERKKKQKY